VYIVLCYIFQFSLETVNTHSSRLQPEKLMYLNRLHLQRQFNSNLQHKLVFRVKEILRSHYSNK